MNSSAKTFPEFCKTMTIFAENQIDFHRPKYYKASRAAYSNIMKCYEEPRKTNEETDACAKEQRSVMENLQKELTHKLMFQSKQLEVCTDTCKDEKDMECLNKCGNQYISNTMDEYDSTLGDYLKNYYASA